MSLLSRWFGPSRKVRPVVAPRRRCRPSVETLEDRRLLSTIVDVLLHPITTTEGQAPAGNWTVAQVAVQTNGRAGTLSSGGTISWGDGATSPAIIVYDAADSSPQVNQYFVQGSHVYQEQGGKPVTVKVAAADGTPGQSSGVTVSVLDAPLDPGQANPVHAVLGVPVTATVATFADEDPGGTRADYAASIDWGDDSSSAGGVVQVGMAGTSPVFAVQGTHTYTTPGTHVIKVSVNDEGVLAGWNSYLEMNTEADVTTTPPPTIPPPRLFYCADALATSVEYYTEFVTTAYQTYLHRAPDAAGLAGWVWGMQHGVTDEQIESCFIGSAEYIVSKGARPGNWAPWVTSMYQDLLGRAPSAAEVQEWVAGLNRGISTTFVAHGFAASAERETVRVTAIYEKFLDRAPTAVEVAQWVNAFEAGLATDEYIIAGFVGSAEYFHDHGGDATTWIVSAYEVILGHAPDSAGEQAWLTFLESGL